MESIEIKKKFRAQLKVFYFINFMIFIFLLLSLYFSNKLGVYQNTFIPICILFFVWIFNADKFYSCPACNGNPRGKNGLIYPPRKCSQCSVELI